MLGPGGRGADGSGARARAGWSALFAVSACPHAPYPVRYSISCAVSSHYYQYAPYVVKLCVYARAQLRYRATYMLVLSWSTVRQTIAEYHLELQQVPQPSMLTMPYRVLPQCTVLCQMLF